MKIFPTLFLLCFLCACSNVERISSVLEYPEERYYMFDKRGEIVDFSLKNIERTQIKLLYDSRLNERGEWEIFRVSDGKIIRRAKPFEKIILCGIEKNKSYFLCNDKSEFTRLECLNHATKKFEVIAELNADIYVVDFFENKLARTQFFNGYSVYFNDDLARAEAKIKREFSPIFIFWEDEFKSSDKRLARLDYSDKPSDYIVCTLKPFEIFEVIKGEKISEKSERRKYFYTTRDGLKLDAILTFPTPKFGGKNLPLIIFPHGGPFASNDETFDVRAFALAQAGFLVAQPNYRGSANRGKSIRFAGLGLDGIMCQQNDIEDCALDLVSRGLVDKNRIGIMGGSWGGFCVQYGMVFKGKTYKVGVSIFGCSDIEDMLKTFPKESKYHLALDSIQFGTLPKDSEKMAEISPLQNAEKMNGKLLMFHFYDDEIIDFQQSKVMFERLVELKKCVEFSTGKGDHSFGDYANEVAAYKKICLFFKENLR